MIEVENKQEKKLIQKFVREKEGEINALDVFFEWVEKEGKKIKVGDILAWLKGFLSRLTKKEEKWRMKLKELSEIEGSE